MKYMKQICNVTNSMGHVASLKGISMYIYCKETSVRSGAAWKKVTRVVIVHCTKILGMSAITTQYAFVKAV